MSQVEPNHPYRNVTNNSKQAENSLPSFFGLNDWPALHAGPARILASAVPV